VERDLQESQARDLQESQARDPPADMITTAVITAMDTTVNPTVHCEQDKSK
jgi:hypothetical protein